MDVKKLAKLEAIEKRLAGVEGSLKRWKFGAVALLVVVVGGAAASPYDLKKVGDFESVTTTRIHVVNKEGKTCGLFGFMPDGTNNQLDGTLPILALGSPDGKQMTRLQTGKAEIEAIDKDGKQVFNR